MDYTVIGINFDNTLIIEVINAKSITEACHIFTTRFSMLPEAVFYGAQYDVMERD
jgi:hypothetical protein